MFYSLIITDLPTKPEFASKVAKTSFVADPVAVEINGSVLSPLKHLQEIESKDTLFIQHQSPGLLVALYACLAGRPVQSNNT